VVMYLLPLPPLRLYTFTDCPMIKPLFALLEVLATELGTAR
jgi:hypothetical protein